MALKGLSGEQSEPPAQPAPALRDCIARYCARDTLGKADAWFCPKCKSLQEAKKQLAIWSLPQCLVVHLKRFESGAGGSLFTSSFHNKIDTQVAFPRQRLSLDEFMAPDAGPSGITYHLVRPRRQAAPPPAAARSPVRQAAISMHHGSGIGGGHYTAAALDDTTGRWRTFDDSSVSDLHEGDVEGLEAYVLFYIADAQPLFPQ